MYFPSDMNFQYFFFDTYIGCFLQALPIALLVSAVFGIVRYRKDNATPISRKLHSCLFVCYITGLICLVVGLDVMNVLWYTLLYRMESGHAIGWFNGAFDFVPDFFSNINGEAIGNFLMFLPFGVLYPLTKDKPSWKNTLVAGLVTVLSIEVMQPIFGRSFDINDIILNTVGVMLSASIFFAVRRLIQRAANRKSNMDSRD